MTEIKPTRKLLVLHWGNDDEIAADDLAGQHSFHPGLKRKPITLKDFGNREVASKKEVAIFVAIALLALITIIVVSSMRSDPKCAVVNANGECVSN
jgi:hypothetical protein